MAPHGKTPVAGLPLSGNALKFFETAEGEREIASDPSPAGKWKHPPSFYCPISRQCLHDPVVLSDGHTYERRHIERWLQDHNTSPVSNEELTQKLVFPNHALRNAVTEYFEQVFSAHRGAIQRTVRAPEIFPTGFGSNEPLLQTIDALMQCSFLMNADLSTEVVLRQIMDEAKALLGADAASVFLVDLEKQELYSRVNSTSGELRVPISAGIAGHVASTGEALIINDAYTDDRFSKDNDQKTGFRTRNMMCVPLKVKKGGVLGVVQLINKTSDGVFASCQDIQGVQDLASLPEDDEEIQSPPCFTPHDLQFLQVFASQAATAVANSGEVFHTPQMQPHSDDSELEYDALSFPKCRLAPPVPNLNTKEINMSPSSSEAASLASISTCSSPHGQVPACRRPWIEQKLCIDIPREGELAFSGLLLNTKASEKHPAIRNRRRSRTASEGDLSCGTLARIAQNARAADQRDAKQSRRQARISRSICLLDEVSKLPEVIEILEDAFNSWQVDAFTLASLTNNMPLSVLGMYLLERLGLLQHFRLDCQKVKAFLIEIENGYDDANPYHNRAHAASVLHAMHALLEHGGIAKAVAAVPNDTGSRADNEHLQRLACLLAAAVHDFEHLGVSNDFLVRIGDKRAMVYNDQHVNESHHVAAAFAVLHRPECNFLAGVPHAEFRQLRSLIVELVISTDIVKGGKILKSFNKAFAVGEDFKAQTVPASSTDAVLLLQMAIKCADLGHLALSWDVHEQWVAKLEEEFFAQGDQEKAWGHSVSFLMDRTQPGCSKTQTGFFRFVVIPLFRSLVAVAPQAQPVLDAIMANYRDWQKLEATGVKDKDLNEQQ